MNLTSCYIIFCSAIIGLIQCASFGKLHDAKTYHNDKEDLQDSPQSTQADTAGQAGKVKPYSLPFYILPSRDRSRGLAALGIGGTRTVPYRAGKRTAGTPYYSLPSGQRNNGLSSLGIGSSTFAGKRDYSGVIETAKRVASFLPSYVIPPHTSRNRGLAPLGIGSPLFRSGRASGVSKTSEEQQLTDDDKVLTDMTDILAYLKTEIDAEEHERLLKRLDEIVDSYPRKE